MSMRINKIQNFKGKSYIVSDELDNLIKSLAVAGAGTVAESAANTWTLQFTTADGGTANTVAADLTAIKTYIDSATSGVSLGAGDGIDIDANSKINTKIKLVKLGSATTGYAASYKLQVWDHTANSNAGDWKDCGDSSATIDIVKDQFIKSAAFGWSTANDATGAGWTTTKSDSAKYPCIKIEVWTNKDGDTSSSDDTATSIYVPLASVFEEYKAGNGIEIGESNAIAVKLDGTHSEQVTVASGSSVDVLTVGADGVKVANVQSAIDYAVGVASGALNSSITNVSSALHDADVTLQSNIDNASSALNGAVNNVSGCVDTVVSTTIPNVSSALHDEIGSASDALQSAIDDLGSFNTTAIESAVNAEHVVMASAVSAVDGKVNSLASSTSSAVTALNTKANAIATNAQSAATALEGEIVALDSKVDSAFAALDTAVETAVDSICGKAVQLVVSNNCSLTSGTSGNYSLTINDAVEIVAVYGADDNIEIYPEITKSGSSFVLTADYGSSGTTEKWNVAILKLVDAVDVTDTTYNVTASAAKTVGSGTDADAPTPGDAVVVQDWKSND